MRGIHNHSPKRDLTKYRVRVQPSPLEQSIASDSNMGWNYIYSKMYFPVQGNPCLFFEHTVFNENGHKRKQLYGLLKSGGHVDTDAVQISPSLYTN